MTDTKVIKTITAWRMGFFFMGFGGKLHRPIKAQVEVHDTVKICGRTMYVIKQPGEKLYWIAEGVTGGFVGHGDTAKKAIAQVAKDIRAADPKVIKQQIKDAKEEVKHAQELETGHFWQSLQ